jgi:hypothetical protein
LMLIVWATTSYTQDVEAELKKMLQGRINAIFHKWDAEEWSWDDYIDESAIVSVLEESSYSTDRMLAKGAFRVSRPLGRVTVKFEAKIEVALSGMTILSLCYIDSSVDDSDCCDPADWGLQRISFQ